MNESVICNCRISQVSVMPGISAAQKREALLLLTSMMMTGRIPTACVIKLDDWSDMDVVSQATAQCVSRMAPGGGYIGAGLNTH